MSEHIRPRRNRFTGRRSGARRMLTALMDGRALTSGELARIAGIAPQTASGHLAASVRGRTARGVPAGAAPLSPPRLGRDRANARKHDGGRARHPGRTRPRGRDRPARRGNARRPHLLRSSGRNARRADRQCLVKGGYIELSDEAGAVTETGIAFLGDFGVDPAAGSRSGKRVFCRPCLDWSERRAACRRHARRRARGALLRAGLDRADRRQPRRVGNAGRSARVLPSGSGSGFEDPGIGLSAPTEPRTGTSGAVNA